MLNNKKNLVFQGGSVKGIAYLGAIGALQRLNHLNFDHLERIAGTSAGAMTALALALNYSTDDLSRVLSVDVQEFLDDANSRVSKKTLLGLKDAAQSQRMPLSHVHAAPAIFLDLKENLGIFPGKEVRDWLEKLIHEKTGITNCTFEELHKLRYDRPELHFKDLYVVGLNLNTKSAKTFCWDKTPKAIIADSVRISMGIPFLFSPYQYFEKNEEGEAVLAEAFKNDLWIDGGIAENYPVRIFDTVEVNMETLGFYLANREELNLIDGTPNPSGNYRVDINGILDYSMAVLESALCVNQQLIQHIRGGDRKRTIYIDILDIGTLDFNITVEQKNSLIQSGWNAALKFVNSLLPESEEKIQLMGSWTTQECPIKIPTEVPIADAKSSCILS